MKKIILTLLILLFSNSSFSQNGWFCQNPSPVGNPLEDCCFVNESTGYAVGWDGVIIKTTNGGINWIQQYSAGNRFLNSVFFCSFIQPNARFQ